VTLAAALCEPPVAPWAPGALGRRAGLRAAVDALVAQVYGLDARDLAVVLADFPLLDRGYPGSSVTPDAVLREFLRRRGERAPDDLAARCASARGAIAYVPGELAAHLRAAPDPVRPAILRL
jgi:hypothetical protein